MTPEEAQAQTEQRWRAKTADPEAMRACGWCMFAVSLWLRSGGETHRPHGLNRIIGRCSYCPIPRVLSKTCSNVPEYQMWLQVKTDWRDLPREAQLQALQKLARVVYDMVVSRRKDLIAEGHKILGELEL